MINIITFLFVKLIINNYVDFCLVTGVLNNKNTQCWVVVAPIDRVNGPEMVDNCSSPDLPSGMLTYIMLMYWVTATKALIFR